MVVVVVMVHVSDICIMVVVTTMVSDGCVLYSRTAFLFGPCCSPQYSAGDIM